MMSGFEKGVLGEVYEHAFDVLGGNRLKSSTLQMGLIYLQFRDSNRATPQCFGKQTLQHSTILAAIQVGKQDGRNRLQSNGGVLQACDPRLSCRSLSACKRPYFWPFGGRTSHLQRQN